MASWYEVIIALTAQFIAGNVYAEWRNRFGMPPQDNPLSAYLAGVPGARVQSASYLLFMPAMVLLAPALHGGLSYWAAMIVGAACLGIVVTTKWAQRSAGLSPADISELESVHRYAAGVAYLTLNWVVFDYSLHHYLHLPLTLSVAALGSVVFMAIFEPDRKSVMEKFYTGLLLAALLSLIIGLLIAAHGVAQ